MLKCTFLGDIMCTQEILQAFRNDTQFKFDELFDPVRKLFDESDFVMGNLESPISYDNTNLTSERYRFNSPYEFAEAIKNAGINAVATANNHCCDRGIDGVKSTVKSLDKIGLIHTGCMSREKEPTIVSLRGGGVKIGLLSYTYGTNAFSNQEYLTKATQFDVNLFQNQELSNPLSRYCFFHNTNLICKVYNKGLKIAFPNRYACPIYERREFDWTKKKALKADIRRTRDAGADIVVMYMHIGGQYNSEPTNYTKKMAKWLTENGVDIVCGSHEHVVHGGDFSKIKKGKLITYSLGNFDGINGVYAPPMNKKSEYSIAWHIYLEKCNKGANITKTSFSVLKCIALNDNKLQTVPVYDLIQKESDLSKREKLIQDMKKVAEIFGGEMLYFEPKQEYELT